MDVEVLKSELTELVENLVDQKLAEFEKELIGKLEKLTSPPETKAEEPENAETVITLIEDPEKEVADLIARVVRQEVAKKSMAVTGRLPEEA